MDEGSHIRNDAPAGQTGDFQPVPVPRGVWSRAGELIRRVPLVALAGIVFWPAWGIARASAGTITGPPPSPAVKMAIQGLSAMVAAVGFACLAWAVGPVLTRDFITPAGLERRRPWRRRLIPWADIYDMTYLDKWVLLVGAEKITVPTRWDFRFLAGTAQRLWQTADKSRRLVPLVNQSFVGTLPWSVAAAVGLSLGGSLIACGIRPTDSRSFAVAGGVIFGAGLLALLRRACLRSERVEISADGISRSTILGRREIPWANVEAVQERVVTLSDVPIHGRIGVESVSARIFFRTPPAARRQLAGAIAERCPEAFRVDDTTGRITPPASSRAVDVRARMAALAARLRRRYLLTAAGQVLLFPLAMLASLFVLFTVFLPITLDFVDPPISLGTIRDNLNRARAARKSLEALDAQDA